MDPSSSNSTVDGSGTNASSSSCDNVQQGESRNKLTGKVYGLLNRFREFCGGRSNDVKRLSITESEKTGSHIVKWNRTKENAVVHILQNGKTVQQTPVPRNDCRFEYPCQPDSSYEFRVHAGTNGQIKSKILNTAPTENLNLEVSEHNGRIQISCPEHDKTKFSGRIKINKKLFKRVSSGRSVLEFILAEQIKPRQVVIVTLFAWSNVTNQRRKFVKRLRFKGKLDAAYQIYYQGTKVLVIFVVEGINSKHKRELTEMCKKYTPIHELSHHVTLSPGDKLHHKIICTNNGKDTVIQPEDGAYVKYDDLLKRGYSETCFSVYCPEGKTKAQLVHIIGDEQTSFVMSLSDPKEDILDAAYHIYQDSTEKTVSICFFLEGKAPDYENKLKETDSCKLVGGQLTGTQYVQLTPGQTIDSKLECKDSSIVIEPEEGNKVSYEDLHKRKHSKHSFLVVPNEKKEMKIQLGHTLGDAIPVWFEMTLAKSDPHATIPIPWTDEDPQECFEKNSVPMLNGTKVPGDSFCNSLKEEPANSEIEDQVGMLAIKLMKKDNEVVAICYHPDAHKVDSTAKTLTDEHFTIINPVPIKFRLENPSFVLLLQAHANARSHVDIRPASHNLDIKLAMDGPIPFYYSCTSDQEDNVPVEFRVMKNQDIVAEHPFEVRCHGKNKEGKATSGAFMTTHGPVSMQMQHPNISVAPNQVITGNQNTRTNEGGENGDLHMSVGKEKTSSEQVDSPSTSGLQTQRTLDASISPTPQPRSGTKRFENESEL